MVNICEADAAQFAPLYEDSLPLFEKIRTIATRIYRADDVAADMKIRNQLRTGSGGFGHLPVCMAKTNILFYGSESARGANSHVVPVREVRCRRGRVHCGDCGIS